MTHKYLAEQGLRRYLFGFKLFKMTKPARDLKAPTLADIKRAQKRIAPYVLHTPLIRNRSLSKLLNTNVYLKLEVFQPTGAFKVRGAFNKALSLPEDKAACGLIAVSGGNHAQAVAYAAATLGRKSRIFMPETTPRNYLDATRSYGAEIILGRNVAESFQQMKAYHDENWVAIHPFDDPAVIAGQGTAGLEIYKDLPEVTDVIVSIGGGGLIGGISIALKSLKKNVRMWGVETKGADAMSLALAAHRVVQMPAITSIACTLGAPSVCDLTLSLARKYLQSVTVVPDAEAFASLQFLLERAKILVEPAGSCTMAAAERLKAYFTKKSHVVLVLCGGNVSLDDICLWRSRFGSK